MRAGRFDRQILIYLPFESAEIFKYTSAIEKRVEGFRLRLLAKQTLVSQELMCNLCNEAALIAAFNKTAMTDNFLDAVDRIVEWFRKKNKIISREERKLLLFTKLVTQL
jgi:cell division protease FtsH